MGEQELLREFAGGPEEAARRAFDALSCLARRFLRSYLGSRLADAQDREDVVQNTLLRLWAFRPRYRNEGVAAWYALVRRTAENCRADLLRRRREAPCDLEPDWAEPREDELEVLDAVFAAVVRAEASGEMEQAADVLWLGLEPGLDGEARDRRLAAAQLHYLDGEHWERILRLVSPARPAAPALSRETLDDWLRHPGILRLLAFAQLFYPGDRLAALLLDLEGGAVPGCLDRLMRDACGRVPEGRPPGGWSWEETRVILWRYRNALSMLEIQTRHDCPLNPEALRGLEERLASLLPFRLEMRRLCERLGHASWISAAELFDEPGLWQRLAFQYRYFEGLPLGDILERTQPAAAVVDFRITSGMLNVWLSGGRLAQRLARYYAAGGEGAAA